MKVYAKIKCDVCSGKGRRKQNGETDRYLLNADGTERCWHCQGKGEIEKWVNVKLELEK